MHRLFVAIRPPLEIRQLLLSVMGGVPKVRWQTDHQLHLTLRFIGEVEAHVADDISAALRRVHHPPFELSIDGLGTFDRKGQPGVLWARATPHAPLQALHKKIDQACARAGLPPEGRSFSPHITLARLRPGSGSLEPVMATAGDLKSPSFAVESFGLYESTLTSDGALYTLAESYALR